jgi:hypothetical protein
MKWLLYGAILATILVATVAASAGTNFTLVTDGKPACCIVVAEKPTDNAKAASAELQKYVEKMSGVKLEIRSDAEEVSGPKILVGRSRLTDAISGLKIPDGLTPAFTEEGYVINCSGDTLVLAGNDAEVDLDILSRPDPSGSCLGNKSLYLGTRYAVYDLLNRLGVRWFAPGEFGEVVPKSGTLRIAEMSVTERPDFPSRAMFACGGEPGAAMQDDRDMWMVHNRMNPRSPMWFGVPADGSLTYMMPRDMVKEHPEWFALQADGTRLAGMPCMTDELRRNDPKYAGQPRLLDELMKRWTTNMGKGRCTAFSPDDGTPACLCESCRMMSNRFSDGYCAVPPPGQEPGTPGDPMPEYLTSQEYFHFINGILEDMGKNHPGHLITTNGYANRYAPPEVGPEFNRYKNLVIMFADIVGCTIHRYDDPKCWQMRQQYNFLKKWCQLTDKVWLYNYNYTILVSKGTITPMTKRIRTNIPMIKQAGAIGFRDQEWIDLSQLGLPTYVARFALEWNTKADVTAILNDFYSKWYGPAAAPIRDYYETLENAFDSAQCHGHEDVILTEIYSPTVMARLAADIARAEAAAVTESDKTHVRVERLGYDHLCMYVESLQAKKDCRFADAAKLMQQMWNTKLAMRKISSCFGWSPTPYGMDWEADRMTKLAKMSVLAPVTETARFRTDKHDVGRSDRWMAPEFKDTKWQTCSVSNGWQSQGLKDEDGLSMLTGDGHPYRGLAWYRFTVDVPAVPAGKQARLFLPALVNRGWAWVNGHYAGRNNYQQAWFRPQEMDVDVTQYLKPGKNVIALRVECLEEYYGANGVYERPFLYTK